MGIENQLLRLTKEVEDADKYQQQLVGRRDEMLEQLVQEHNCKTLEKADIVLGKYNKMKKRLTRQLLEGLELVEGKV